MSDERRCDECVFWNLRSDNVVANPIGWCRHTTFSRDSHRGSAASSWCENYWPATVPLPKPWESDNPRGAPGMPERDECTFCDGHGKIDRGDSDA